MNLGHRMILFIRIIKKKFQKGHLTCNAKMEILNSPEVSGPDEPSVTIREKATEILEPPGKKVFYNPVQEFNRDLSVLVLQLYSKQLYQMNGDCSNKVSQKPLRILEALSATGLRSIRYAKEIPKVVEVIANDISSEAVKNIEMNIRHNSVENIVKSSQSDAAMLMHSSSHPSNRFQIVDLDPYGSPVHFLDSAVQCVEDGGMLLVTCTDMSILCGHFPETCFAKYGALSLRSQGKHEMAIRIALQCIQSHASRYKRYIVPVLSVSADFYIRIFIKVYTSASACKTVITKLSMVHQCSGCGATILQPLGVKRKEQQYTLPHVPELGGKCTHCGGSQQMGGPIWNGAIHDKNFIAELIKSNEIQEFGTSKRILGMLTLIQEELDDVPLYYSTSALCKTLRVNQIPIITLRSALLNAGYRVSYSHASKDSLKTDAPMSFIWDLFRAWVKENPINEEKIIPGSPCDRILKTEMQNKIDFSERPDANPASRELGLLRYQMNPAPYWGPGVRSTTKILGEPKKKKKKGTDQK